MTEEAKKRMEAIIEDLFSKPRGRRIAEELYKAGMQDPDANSKLVEENKRLLDECEKGLQWMASTAIPLKKRNDAEYLRIMIEDVLIPKSDELLQKLKARGK